MKKKEEIKEQRDDSAMQMPGKEVEEVCAEDAYTAVCDTIDGEVSYGDDEPWLPIETRLVTGSVLAGMITLIILAILVHIFLLGG